MYGTATTTAQLGAALVDEITTMVRDQVDGVAAVSIGGDYPSRWVGTDFILEAGRVRIFADDLDAACVTVIVSDRRGLEQSRAVFSYMPASLVVVTVRAALESSA